MPYCNRRPWLQEAQQKLGHLEQMLPTNQFALKMVEWEAFGFLVRLGGHEI